MTSLWDYGRTLKSLNNNYAAISSDPIVAYSAPDRVSSSYSFLTNSTRKRSRVFNLTDSILMPHKFNNNWGFYKHSKTILKSTYIIICFLIFIFIAVSIKIIQINIHSKYFLSFLQGTWQSKQLTDLTHAAVDKMVQTNIPIFATMTQKMVNYAQVGQIQRKLRWRFATILTHWSVFNLGYRGKRQYNCYYC